MWKSDDYSPPPSTYDEKQKTDPAGVLSGLPPGADEAGVKVEESGEFRLPQTFLAPRLLHHRQVDLLQHFLVFPFLPERRFPTKRSASQSFHTLKAFRRLRGVRLPPSSDVASMSDETRLGSGQADGVDMIVQLHWNVQDQHGVIVEQRSLVIAVVDVQLRKERSS